MNPNFNPSLPSNKWRKVTVEKVATMAGHYCPKCDIIIESRKSFKKHLAEVHSY